MKTRVVHAEHSTLIASRAKWCCLISSSSLDALCMTDERVPIDLSSIWGDRFIDSPPYSGYLHGLFKRRAKTAL